MKNNNIVDDLQLLTAIPKATLAKLFKEIEWCICNSIEESQLRQEKILQLDIGVGDLIIKVEEGAIKYKFLPSKSLEENIRQTYLNKKNPLTKNIEESLAKKIANVYRELL